MKKIVSLVLALAIVLTAAVCLVSAADVSASDFPSSLWDVFDTSKTVAVDGINVGKFQGSDENSVCGNQFAYLYASDAENVYVAIATNYAGIGSPDNMGNGKGTNLRLWFRTNDEATVYTHFVDIEYDGDTQPTHFAKKCGQLHANADTVEISTDGVVSEAVSGEASLFMQAKIPFSVIEATGDFGMFITVSNGKTEEIANNAIIAPFNADCNFAKEDIDRSKNNSYFPYTSWNDAAIVITVGSAPVEESSEPVEESSEEPAEPLPENLENLAEGKSYTVADNNPRGDGYDDNETGKLTDGIVGIENSATDLLGLRATEEAGGVLTTVVDLGEVKDFIAIRAYAVHYDGWGIPAPVKVSFAVSEDGETYGDAIEVTADQAEILAGEGAGAGWEFPAYIAQGEFTGRYVKVCFFRSGAGHVWVSEVQVLAEAAAPVEESSEPAEESTPAEESKPVTPTTGDAGIIALAVVSVIAHGGAVIVKKSK
ncbi:MAG: hypothetical protein J6S70_03965 [Clostridia bacterium]|nr:hypothetical protein [Clostridia bacterium]